MLVWNWICVCNNNLWFWNKQESDEIEKQWTYASIGFILVHSVLIEKPQDIWRKKRLCLLSCDHDVYYSFIMIKYSTFDQELWS